MFNLNLPFANINRRRRRRRGSSNNNDNDNDTTSINEADNNNILHNDDDDDNNKNKKQHHHHHRHNHNGRNNVARRATLTDGQHRAAIRRARSHHANSESNTSRTVLSSSRSVDDNGYYDNNNNANANANANANNLPNYPLHHIHYNERGKGYTPQHKNKQQQQRTYNDANNNNSSNNFDPLRYRLEHQKSVRIEKEKKAKNNNNNKQRIRQRRKSGCSSSSNNKSTNNNNNNNNGGECCDDPFDLGSSTSDEDDDDVSIDASKGDFGAWGDDDDDDNNNYEKDHHHDEEEEDASKGDFGGWEGAYADDDDDDGEDILGGVGGVMDHDRIESSENNSSGEGLFIDYGSIKTAERRKLPKFLFATPEIGLGEGLKRITKSKRRSNKSSNNGGGGRRKSQEDGGSSSNSRRRRRNNQSSTNGVSSSRRRRNGHHQSGRRESQSSISSPKRRKSKTEEEEEEEEEASLHYCHANEDEENDDRSVATTPEGLFVDFGGFLPQEIRGIYNLNDDSDLRRRSDTTAGAVKNQKRHNRLTASITSATAASHQSVHSSLSSVTNFTNYWHDDDDNTTICTTQFDDDKNVGYDVDEHDEEEEVDGLSVEDEKLSSSRATHAELEEILSFLEKESLSPDDPASKGRKSSPLPPSDKPRMKRISSHDHISSFIGEAVNTMKRVTSHKSLSNLQSQQLPLSNNLHRDEDLNKSEKSLTRRLVMSKEEEENPRLYQLNQSSMEELQLEWSKMQSSTKSNLESSWAETERLKCENADIDDQIGEVKKKLEMAKLSSSLKVDQVHLVLTKFDGSDMGSSASNANIIKPRRRQRTIPAFRRGSLRDKLRKSTSSKSLGDKYQLEEEMKEDTALDDSHVSFRTAPVNVQMLDVDGGALDALLEAENGDNIMGQDISSVISSDLGLEVDLLYNEAVAIKSPLEEYCKPISQQDTPEIDDKIFNELLAPKEGDYVDLSFSDKRADESGVFYPAPTKVPDDDSVVSSSADEDAHSNAHLSVHTGALAASLAMDDFDFDPLNTLGAEDTDVNDCKSVKSFKSIKSTKSMKSAAKLMNDKLRRPSRRQTIDRRPSIMDLFNKQDGDDYDDDDDDSIRSSSPPLTSDHMPTKDKEQIKKEAAEVMGSIQAKEKEITNLIESIQTHADEIETRESEINDANVNCCQSEKQLREKEFTLQQENEELAEKDAKTEAKLDDIEDVERKAKEKEQHLILQLESMVDTEKEIEIELEKQLDLWKQEWGTIQAEAIKSVSDLLSDFDAMQIPSLQNEIDNSVRGDDEGLSSDIITRFEAFTDKGEQLVEALCGLYPERLTSSSNWDHEQYQFKSGQYE